MNLQELLTQNISAPNPTLQSLKQHFSHCFDKEGNFLLEKFTAELTTNEVKFEQESYGLTWLGKDYARLLAADAATTLLKEDATFNALPQNANAQNLLIKGDNLEVLKHLTGAYHQKVKMIYIDPPYNTGSDGFVYQDDRKFTKAELQKLAGIEEHEAKRILDFTLKNSNSHSAWLTFMYPRLYIAKQLLKDDGVIFVSIDDNEVAQLRLLMDEVFGEDNFVECAIWKKRSNPPNDKIIASIHEYVLIYSRSKDKLALFRKERGEKQLSRYKNPDNHPKGLWASDNLMANVKGGRYVKSLYFPITNPNTGEEHFPSSDGNWRFNEDKIKHLMLNDEIYFGENGKGRPKLKRFLTDVQDGVPFSTLWDSIGYNNSATNEILNLLGSVNIFDTPKPVNLLKHSLELSSNTSDIILDFFAGSGTTGDAVMQLNAADGGNRSYILVQLPEAIDPKKNKTAYDFVQKELGVAQPTIFEITKERLIRAAQKVNQELADKNKSIQQQISKLQAELPTSETQEAIAALEQEMAQNEQIKSKNGFKVLETMPIWEDYAIEADTFNPQMALFSEREFSSADLSALCTTWQLQDGIMPTQSAQSLSLGTYTAQYAAGKLYLMKKGFETENLQALLEKIDNDPQFNPTLIIVFGHHFESKNLMEIAQNIKSYANKKQIDIDFITRY